MDLDLEKISGDAKKLGAAVLSVGVGVSAAAGFSILDSPDHSNKQISAGETASIDDVSTQIDQNKNKLDAIADSGETGNVDYTRFGC